MRSSPSAGLPSQMPRYLISNWHLFGVGPAFILSRFRLLWCFFFFFFSPHTELEEVRPESLELFGAPPETLGHVGHVVLFSTTVEGPGMF